MLVIQAWEIPNAIVQDFLNVQSLSLFSQGLKELCDISNVSICHQLMLETVQKRKAHSEESQPAIHEEGIQKHHYGGVLEEPAEQCHDPLTSDDLMTQSYVSLKMIVQLRYVSLKEGIKHEALQVIVWQVVGIQRH